MSKSIYKLTSLITGSAIGSSMLLHGSAALAAPQGQRPRTAGVSRTKQTPPESLSPFASSENELYDKFMKMFAQAPPASMDEFLVKLRS